MTPPTTLISRKLRELHAKIDVVLMPTVDRHPHQLRILRLRGRGRRAAADARNRGAIAGLEEVHDEP